MFLLKLKYRPTRVHQQVSLLRPGLKPGYGMQQIGRQNGFQEKLLYIHNKILRMADALKSLFFTKNSMEHLGRLIASVEPGFNDEKFLFLVFDDQWENKELKERMRHVTLSLHELLPDDYEKAIHILMQVAPSVTGFDAMVFPDYVEVFGLKHWDLSFQAFELFTQSCSSEFGVRPFINSDPKRAMEYFYQWSKSDNEHVRRLASEGCRPMLPWAMAIPAFKKDPTPVLPILHQLNNDPSPYVRKSVANNLNDISKLHPELVLETCKRWKGKSQNTDWIIKHACRTMLKAGISDIMEFFGFGNPAIFDVDMLSLNPERLKIGEELQFSFVLNNQADSRKKVRLEYILHFKTKNGKFSPKVFQIKETIAEPGEMTILKKHSFKLQTTRKLYPGEHLLEVKVNGVVKKQGTFQLL
ncbi:MAG: DNA alkylation repair protein [Bacteroidota bacterium]